MGLDVSHDCFSGAYSAFMNLRKKWAKAAGLPPLDLMKGFYEEGAISGDPFLFFRKVNPDDGPGQWLLKEISESLPIKWNSLRPNVLYELLNHSDCDGQIHWRHCKGIAKELKKLLPEMPKGGNNGHIRSYKGSTQKWIFGLEKAYRKKQSVKFR